MSDLELIEASKKDTHYFGELYDRYYDQIFIFIFKKVGGREDVAGDIASNCFLKAMGNIHKYEDRGFPLTSWLYRIAGNETNLFFRKNKGNFNIAVNESTLADIMDEAGIESESNEESIALMLQHINELKEVDLEIIELRFFQGISFKEIAAIHEITEANAKMKTYRILERIQKKMKDK